jgi:small subunit ribosomal protein S17
VEEGTARKRRKVMVGRVVSDRMDKTVVVAVERMVADPIYGKTVRRTRRFKAHDEENRCRVGDRVRLMETRPLSKEKRWRVVEILSRKEEAQS